jgi:hypothetical protein
MPESVQALDGYGEGINADCYNYIDWEKKQFVKRVGVVDMGTLDWSMRESNNRYIFSTISLNDIKPCENFDSPINAICVPYRAVSPSKDWVDKDMSYNTVGAKRIDVVDNAYTAASTFKAAMSGVMLYYELAEPIITDISDILPIDNYIGVEGGGTITAVNEHGLAAPVEIKYPLKTI